MNELVCRGFDSAALALALDKLHGDDGRVHFDNRCLELAIAMQHAYTQDTPPEEPAHVSARVLDSALTGRSSTFQGFLALYRDYKSQPLTSACHVAWHGPIEHVLPAQGALTCSEPLNVHHTLLGGLEALLQRTSAVDGTVSSQALEEIAGTAAAGDGLTVS